MTGQAQALIVEWRRQLVPPMTSERVDEVLGNLIDAALRQARREGLEEAAVLCEDEVYGKRFAALIRRRAGDEH